MNAQEVFNLRHAQLRNVVERIIGVLKRRFRILVVPPQYGMNIQARIPPALSCIHNIIRKLDPAELDDIEAASLQSDAAPGSIGSIVDSVPTRSDHAQMSAMQDRIARDMWDNYVGERARRGQPITT